MSTVEERIAAWREQQPGHEDDDHITLLVDAEDELRRLRGHVPHHQVLGDGWVDISHADPSDPMDPAPAVLTPAERRVAIRDLGQIEHEGTVERYEATVRDLEHTLRIERAEDGVIAKSSETSVTHDKRYDSGEHQADTAGDDWHDALTDKELAAVRATPASELIQTMRGKLIAVHRPDNRYGMGRVSRVMGACLEVDGDFLIYPSNIVYAQRGDPAGGGGEGAA